MRKSVLSKNAMALVFCILIAVIVLTACAPAAQPPVTPPPSAGPKYGGTLHLSAQRDPNRLDPNMTVDAVGPMWALLYSGVLTRWTGKDDAEAALAPYMAKSWDVSADGLTLTYHLNQGMMWQNIPPVNGREVVADDFKYILDKMADPKNRSPLRPYLGALVRTEAADKYAFRMIFSEPYPASIVGSGHGSQALVAKEVEDPEKTWIGPGPFILSEYKKGSGATFVRNPNYWEKGKPYLDKIEIYIIPDESARLAAFRAGRLDSMNTTRSVVEMLKSSVPGVQVVPGVDPRGVVLYMNQAKYPKLWGDVRVRQAVLYALDGDALITAGLDGAGFRSDLLGPRWKEYGVRVGNDLPQRNVAKAKQLLSDAGYPEGFKATMIYSSEGVIQACAEPIAAMLKEAGILLTLKPNDAASQQATLRSGDFEIALHNAQLDKMEVDQCLPPLFQTGGGQNFGGYSNARVDELISLQRKAYGNPSLRAQHIRELVAIVQKEQPFVPIGVNYQYLVRQPYVRGSGNHADGNGMNAFAQMMHTWLDK